MAYPTEWYSAKPIGRLTAPKLKQVYDLRIPNMGNKLRPCVVLNIRGDCVLVVPLSTKTNHQGTATRVGKSFAAVNQLTTVNSSMLINALGSCSDDEFAALRDEVASSLRMLNYELIKD